MSTTSQPFGLIPIEHMSGGTIRRTRVGSRNLGVNGISTGDTNTIGYGALVKFTTSGFLTRAASTDAVLAGVFAGCEYDDSTGRHVLRWWDAPTGATNIVAYIFRDPLVIYKIQADGTLGTSNIGNNANIGAATSISTASGQSGMTLGTGGLTSSSTGQLQVLEILDSPDNASGDSFTYAKVKLAQGAFGGMNYNAF